jgi:hypothetical protein
MDAAGASNVQKNESVRLRERSPFGSIKEEEPGSRGSNPRSKRSPAKAL